MERNSLARNAEIAYVVLILATAGVIWGEASALPPALYDALGPKAFPLGVSGAMALLGGIMLLRIFTGRSLGQSGQMMMPGLDEPTSGHAWRPWIAVTVLVLAFCYAIALTSRSIGFLAATAAYLFSAGIVLGRPGQRRLVATAVFAVAAAVVLDTLFKRFFSLDLP